MQDQGLQSSSTMEMAAVLSALNALKRGNSSVRLPAEWTGLAGKVAEVFNDVVEQNQRLHEEVGRLSRVVGREGKLNTRGSLGQVSGFWRESIESINDLIDDLVHPTSETARVIGAVAQAISRRPWRWRSMIGRCRGVPAHRETINKMVNQLGSFATEVTRVAREVGTEGKLGGQAKVERRRGHLEGSDGQRQLDGRQPDRPGP